MRWTGEQYLAHMTFAAFERPMFVELFGPLVGLEPEWRQQGATEAELNLTAFGFDFVEAHWAGARCGPLIGPSVVIEESDAHRIERDGLGRTLHLDKRTATIPLPVTFPVKSMDDWLRLKPLFAWRPDRIVPDAVERARVAREQGGLVVFGMPGAFNMLRELMGEELACLAVYDEPELVRDMLDTFGNTCRQGMELLSSQLTIDQLSVHEDFAGRSGPLVGPAVIREFWQPYYQGCWTLAQSAGARLFQLDSDGNVNPVIEALLACGINSLFPMEPAAGMDLVACRRRYGQRLACLGGLDKHALRAGPAAIRAELEYKLQLKHEPGIVFGLDHRIPNGTPLADYRYYVSLARELLGLPPPAPGEWRRMAF